MASVPIISQPSWQIGAGPKLVSEFPGGRAEGYTGGQWWQELGRPWSEGVAGWTSSQEIGVHKERAERFPLSKPRCPLR